jgi:hypothetical protein
LPLSLASTLMSGGYVEDLLCKYFLIYWDGSNFLW